MRTLISLFSVCFVIACSLGRVVRVQAWAAADDASPSQHLASCSKLVQINGTKEDSYYCVM